MALKVGITGGIGSGKSTVCKIFETLGIPVYYADDRAKLLMTSSKSLVNSIKELLGENAYSSNGELNRPFIAEKVFKHKELLNKLNALVHPAVWKDGEEWHQKQQSPYTIKEAALLFESSGNQFLDKIITVIAPEEIRIQRVMARDSVSQEQVQSRMNKQWAESKKAAMSDYVITNDGKTMLIPQVLHIHQSLLEMAL